MCERENVCVWVRVCVSWGGAKNFKFLPEASSKWRQNQFSHLCSDWNYQTTMFCFPSCLPCPFTPLLSICTCTSSCTEQSHPSLFVSAYGLWNESPLIVKSHSLSLPKTNFSFKGQLRLILSYCPNQCQYLPCHMQGQTSLFTSTFLHFSFSSYDCSYLCCHAGDYRLCRRLQCWDSLGHELRDWEICKQHTTAKIKRKYFRVQGFIQTWESTTLCTV